MDTLRSSSSPATGMPPIRRGSMVPLPWLGLARRLRGETAPADAPWRHSAQALAVQPQAWEGVARQRRRWLLFWVLLSTAFVATVLWSVQPAEGSVGLQVAQMALFTLLFAWVAAGCVTAVMGFLVTLRGDAHAMSARRAGTAPIDDEARTAIIMPICNEDVATVFAGLRATCESLAQTGEQRAFDVFVLSDSNRPELRSAELAAWQSLRETLQAAGNAVQVHYRWRQHRTRRKAGNVADFCRRWGRAFRYMVVLDADSVMSGESLVTLVRLMEHHPNAGILQTAPRACGHATLHARAQQFASRVTGRLFTAGMQFWQLGEAHYWGHNAIIRIEPFMKHCALASLPGTGALAGEILSHDFVEAALMRRAGYEVWLVNDLEGSFEQQPPHLLAELQRDRRWCMGNLQNARLISEPGLHGVHRAMLFTGAMAYVSAPLWLLYVALGALLWSMGGRSPEAPLGLFAHEGAALLWLVTGTMLVLPRVLGVLAIVWNGEQAAHGGALKLVGSSVFEALLSMLQAPLRMAAHSLFVIGGLTGWALEWKSPPRDATDVPWSQAARQFGGLSLLVAGVLAAVAWVAPEAVGWLLPMGLPVLLAVPFTVWCSREALGARWRDAGWLVIPEEARSPVVLQRAWSYAREPMRPAPLPGLSGDLQRLAQLVLQAVGPRRTGAGLRGRLRQTQVRQLALGAAGSLPVREQMRFLSEPHSLRLLHAAMVGSAGHAAS
ncbi:membrane glycosyltransferase [Sphaerotilus hippei]|uniref:Glucans biosynthesis glucosyltransferase H n=1 Tax=Sphaerotilus hippei TaxID=744406 RepID=A0A318H6C9_9BURK|nr:glucans biosynthesis glucosyltransferase MdoH [Sphaerotilus hippei]PXW99550.1 membrane glycosyltransferase [Sphaerotilus hippei]